MSAIQIFVIGAAFGFLIGCIYSAFIHEKLGCEYKRLPARRKR